MPAYMVNPRMLNVDEIIARKEKYFKRRGDIKNSWYKYRDPIASNIDQSVEQPRPAGLYIFAHVGDDEPDAKHIGESYDQATSQEIKFLNPEEYEYVSGFHLWKYKRFMDSKGWTRLSSLWSGGILVIARWRPYYQQFYVSDGNRDDCDSRDGVRELFLG